MKIICVGRNYAAHAEELQNEVPTEPVLFIKPDSAVLRSNEFYIPEFSSNIHYEVELVLKICKPGKYILEKNAHKHYDKIGLGIDFTARDLQNQLKEKGLPWEKAKGFDSSAVARGFSPVGSFNLQQLAFSLQINGHTVQEGNSSLMLYNFDKLVAYISQFFTLKKGDLIFTGTPKGVGNVKEDDILEGFLDNRKVFSIKVY